MTSITAHNKGKTYPSEIMTHQEISALLQACNRGLTGERNKALIVTLWRSGLRISEALALRPQDIDLERATLMVLRGKGKKQRQVAIDPGTVEALRTWLTRRKAIPGINGHAVFCTLMGRAISTQYVRGLLPRLAEMAGVEKRVHPHCLRHTAAYDMLSEGIRLDIIQRILGHSSIAVTARYIAHLAQPEVQAVIDARVWPTAALA